MVEAYKGALSLKERKELIDATRRLIDLGLISRPDRAADINNAGGDLKRQRPGARAGDGVLVRVLELQRCQRDR